MEKFPKIMMMSHFGTPLLSQEDFQLGFQEETQQDFLEIRTAYYTVY